MIVSVRDTMAIEKLDEVERQAIVSIADAALREVLQDAADSYGNRAVPSNVRAEIRDGFRSQLRSELKL